MPPAEQRKDALARTKNGPTTTGAAAANTKPIVKGCDIAWPRPLNDEDDDDGGDDSDDGNGDDGDDDDDDGDAADDEDVNDRKTKTTPATTTK